MSERLTINEFVDKANLIHKNKYNYSKCNYTNSHQKIEIVCYEHGEFWQKPNNHLCGKGCPKCGVLNSKKLKIKSNKG